MQSEPLHRILERFAGIATRGQLIGSGAHPDHLAAAVREGSILRVRRAHYAAVNADPRAVSAVRIGGRLTASSAARSYGLCASHGSKGAFEQDRMRDSRARLRGAPVVRFTARQVSEQWPVVVETIDALLEREAA